MPHDDSRTDTCRSLAAAGLAHARADRFFAAHEDWEALWLELRGDERLWLQALIQLVVALHHAEAGNEAGWSSLREKAAVKLERLEAAGFATPPWAAGLGLPVPDEALRALAAGLPAAGLAARLFPSA